MLDLAKEQLDVSDITDLRFKYIERKQGKRIVGFDFIVIKTDASHEYEKQIKVNAPSLRWDFNKTLVDNFAFYNIVAKGKTAETIKAYQAKFGEHKLAQDLESFARLAQKNNARNIPAYIMTCFKKELNADNQPTSTNIKQTPKTAPASKGTPSAQPLEKEAWEMSKDERIAHAMKRRAETEPSDGLKKIADIFGNLKN